jgi:hypothetical protein
LIHAPQLSIGFHSKDPKPSQRVSTNHIEGEMDSWSTRKIAHRRHFLLESESTLKMKILPETKDMHRNQDWGFG